MRHLLPRGMHLILAVGVAIGLACAGGSTAAAADVPDPAAVKLMTFNIRCVIAADGPDQWQFRKEMVIEVIEGFSPDFLGVQEATPEQVVYLREKLSTLGCLNRSREADPTLGESCAVFYRKARWTLDPDYHGTFWLSETPEVPGSRSWETACVRIATWGRFTEHQTGRAIWVYNTHLDHVSQQARLEGAKLLARRIADRKSDEPVALLGDFNAGESSRPIRHLSGQDPEAPVKLVDTFRVVHRDAKEVGTFGGFHGRKDGEKIDYILVLPKTKVTSAAIDRQNRQGRYPSDHYPVTAEIVLPEK